MRPKQPRRRRWSSGAPLASIRILAVVIALGALLLVLQQYRRSPLSQEGPALPRSGLEFSTPGAPPLNETLSPAAAQHSGPSHVAKLSNGVLIPKLGFGTAGLGEGTREAATWALESGYRLFDSAQAREWYREDLLGAALTASSVPRKDLFLVSKLHPKHSGYALTKERFGDSLRDLAAPYLDLFLLHYPWCFAGICGDHQPAGTWQDSWRALEELYDEGKVRAIGVSNFDEAEFKTLLRVARVRPHVVQRHSDPFSPDTRMREVCAEEGVVYMGYSTLGSQWLLQGFAASPVLSHAVVTEIGLRRTCTPAQVVLKWALSKGQVVIPRSGNKQRMRDNLDAWSCRLMEEDIAAVDGLAGTVPKAT